MVTCETHTTQLLQIIAKGCKLFNSRSCQHYSLYFYYLSLFLLFLPGICMVAC